MIHTLTMITCDECRDDGDVSPGHGRYDGDIVDAADDGWVHTEQDGRDICPECIKDIEANARLGRTP